MTSSELRVEGAWGDGKPSMASAPHEADGASPGAFRRKPSKGLKFFEPGPQASGPAGPSRTDIPSVLVLRDDGIFASKERFRSLHPDPAHCDPAHAGALAFRDIFLLAPSGDRYLRPRAFQRLYQDAFVSRLEAEGLTPAVLDSPTRHSDPAVIVRTSPHIFVPARAFAAGRVPSAFTAESIFLKDAGQEGGFSCLATLDRDSARIEARLTLLQLELIGSQIESRFDRDRSMAAAWREFGPEGSGGCNEIVGDEDGVH